MSAELGPRNTKQPELTQFERDQIVFDRAVAFVLKISAKEDALTLDNYGGALLNGGMPFGD